MITVVRQGEDGSSARSDGPYTGTIWRDMLLQPSDGPVVSKNFFTPCARTYWHSHPGGQLLIIEHGEGLVGDESGAVRVVAGDMIWTPPRVRHWHGATSERSMMHTAVTISGVTWEDEVADEEYTRLQHGARSSDV